MPSLISRSRRSAGTNDSTRRRMACTSGTKSSRSHAVHTIGMSASTYALPRSGSPTAGRAFSSA
ncbi:Uncharacterised protein [Mycobacteroides abscessus subsp. abscessus]|nr:Uncharacterised protein [Mycobacteroides abscessus subsp. abscessus]